MSHLTDLEIQVIDMLLAGDLEVLSALREQLRHVTVVTRKISGVGFFTNFEVSAETPRVSGRPSFKLGDVNGEALNLKHGLGFLLYVTDGMLSGLEGYTYDEPWPDDVKRLRLTYSDGRIRDVDKLRKILEK